MLVSPDPPIVGIVAINSPHYVETALRFLAQGSLVVPLRAKDDSLRQRAAGVSEVVEPRDGFGWFTPTFSPLAADVPAVIGFTSGTEGQAKGVLLTHGALADVVERLNLEMKLNASVREYIGVPVYHSFGFGRCRAIAAVGGQAYLPEDGFNPVEIAEMLKRGEINAISAVPSLWRALLEAKDLFVGVGDRVLWIEIGSQFMGRAEKKALTELFPNARIVQHYGLTEASRTTLLSIHEANDDELDSVGRATHPVEVRINGEGRILIRGPHVTGSVIVDGQAASPRDAEGWLLTSDLGRIENGFLYYEGRADDVINCGGLKLAPEALELAIRQQLVSAGEFAICRVSDAIRGDGMLLACTPSSSNQSQALFEALVEEAAKVGVHARGAIRVVEVDALPRTDTGKVQRKQLALMTGRPIDVAVAKHQMTPASDSPQEELNQRERELLEIWREALGTSAIGVNDSFYDLGGDSVTALTVVVRMSRAGIDIGVCRRIFHGATIKELATVRAPSGEPGSPKAAKTQGNTQYLTTVMVNVLRGLLVLSVVLGHWSPGAVDRIPALEPLKPLFSSFFSFGTPGFAISFGLGFGYLYLAKFRENPARMNNVVRLATAVIAGGVIVLAALRPLSGETNPDSNFFVLFYSALTFYLLAVPTMPLWFRLISKATERARIPFILGLSLTAFVTAEWLRDVIGTEQPDGFLRLARLLVVAKYNYFTMIGGVLAGVAVGYYVQTRASSPAALGRLATLGAITFAVSLAIAFGLGEAHYLTEWPSPLTAWKWLLYYGVIQLLLAGLLALRDGYSERALALRRTLEGLATVGQLALPFFVLHESIVPLTRFLRRVGVPGEFATALTLSVFFLVSWAMLKKIHSFFHAA